MDEQLVRAELFSPERLEQHAESLAAAQPVAESARASGGRSLSRRLRENALILREAYRTLSRSVAEGQPLTPAAEWLVDNYHVIQAQVREISGDLPPGYYRQLPKLVAGPFVGYPRVLGIAWAFIAHTDSRFDPQLLCRFVQAYQRRQPLTIGELWAVAITLRIVLVENLRRAAAHLIEGRAARQQADAVADDMIGAAGAEPVALPAVVHRIRPGPLSASFAVQLVQRLRGQDPIATPALQWLENRLAAQGTTADEIVATLHHDHAAMTVTIRNVITSMRLVSTVHWPELVESVSKVDELLKDDSDFASMDFVTRNRYRTAIEELARGSGLPELHVTRALLQTCRAQPAATDPGHFLLAGGRREFEAAIDYRVPIAERLRRFCIDLGIVGYVGAVALFTLVVAVLPLLVLAAYGLGPWGLAAAAALAVLPSAHVAVALLNRLVAAGVPPRQLPGLALRGGIPESLRTIVAVPTLLTSAAAITEQIERLEIHYLASPDGDVVFALLTDWTDSPSETAPDDQSLLGAAIAGITRLNQLYPVAEGSKRFLLLHRKRVWNSVQGQWIGWERKRGKLHELNRLLRGATDTTFLPLDGMDPAVPAGVRYVVTLDSDTRLPREAVRRLVGKMAHPLNRPIFDPALGRVVGGHGVLQPRVTPSLPLGAEASIFQYAFSTAGGIDPYAAAVSDVYQDLFDEGSYAGKGIYDLDIFEQALAGRVPDSTLLSHDLFEGIFIRAGLVTDIEVIEEFPARYDVAASRQHRWTRGDWQLLPWIFGRQGKSVPRLGVWKMADNLRRSLTPPALVLALFAGWLLPLGQALCWTGFLLLTIALPSLLAVFDSIVPRLGQTTLRNYLRGGWIDTRRAGVQIGLEATLLADQAALTADGILRTLARLYITRRHLLEWTTAEQAKTRHADGIAAYYARMSGTLAVAALALVLLLAAPRHAWIIVLPFALLWCLAPAIAWWISRSDLSSDSMPVSAEAALELRVIALRTWRFFDTFVTEPDHLLPPDNFQEDPRPVLARRTSPTNIGLYLLSVVAAREFGWIGLTDALGRLEATFDTMDRLERLHGHFYNWYDTGDLRPLDPKYISSVDSGNLAGHLIALANTCEVWNGTAPLGPWIPGIADMLTLCNVAAHRLQTEAHTDPARGSAFTDALRRMSRKLDASSDAGPAAISDEAMQLAERARALHAATAPASATLAADAVYWADAISRAVAGHARDATPPGQPAAAASPATIADLAAVPADAGTCTSPASRARSLERRLTALAARARIMAGAMRFDFLMDPDRKLLSIGFLASDGSLDQSCYDLLASEARLASFLAVAYGDAPVAHWFRLGRAVTAVGRGAALVSWSGSMFEYLMPSLVMRAPTGSLLATTNRLIVRRQRSYAEGLGLPWGMSESAYNARDLEFTYQYSNFGIPDLALKRGLGEDAVLAPYATALATMVDPEAASRNFLRLETAGGLGRYGFYDALDYTPSRLQEGQDVAVVRTYMAHHQGMTIVAILNTALDGIMRTRFHAEPRVQATELLLQERTPRDSSPPPEHAEETPKAVGSGQLEFPVSRRISSPHGAAPATQILSNGRYSVMVTAAGSGYSRWQDRAITRWREDLTRDDWGSYLFLRDVADDTVWSAGYQPSAVEPDSYDVVFTEERVEIMRRDGAMLTRLEIVVSAEDDAEVRRVTLSNTGSEAREIELTSYMEIVLAGTADDAAHPAFSKMFVQTEFIAELGAVLATRRRRAPSEPEIWAAHLVVVEGEAIGDLHVETDRAAFLGRGRELRDPAAMAGSRPLTGTTGTVLDPIFSLRRRVRVAPGGSARLAFWTIAAGSRGNVLDLVDRHREHAAFDRAVTLAWTQAQVQLSHLAITRAEAASYQRLAGHLMYVGATLRPSQEVLRRGGGGPSLLWAQSISGDLPILLVRIDDSEDIALVRQLLRAHEYWRMKRLAVDLVILNEKPPSYVQDLQSALDAAVRMGQTRAAPAGGGVQGSVYVLRADLVPQPTQALLLSVARAVLASRRGTLTEQLDRMEDRRAPQPPPPRAPPAQPSATTVVEPQLEFFNGLGGFADGGREYVTVLRRGETTPAPWTNIIANPAFGFQVTADGGGYSWWYNSRENQLTPWSNDPTADRPGDMFYLRDEDSGALWSPTAQPIRHPAGRYEVHHGLGYSRFHCDLRGIEADLLQFVPVDDPIKISRLRLRNTTGRSVRLSLTAYVEWVLGPSRTAALATIVTERDADSGAVLARNPWNTAFGPYVAFLALPGRSTRVSGDRREFLGRNGTLAAPAALLRRSPLSDRLGAGLDPCTALQTTVELAPNETTEIVCLLGVGSDTDDARHLIARTKAADLDSILGAVTAQWENVTGAVQVKTPDRAMDILLNRWLLYQTLACRIWARCGFYQASGAYGFRDQLQDGMAIVGSRPDLARTHLLRAAARQFSQGDVQHWWLPPSGQGVRTRISDDRVWLAYAGAHYVSATGDHAVLDEDVSFLDGPELTPQQHEAYYTPRTSDTRAPLYEHCALGLDHALATGQHGLPLIGTGDWNDGMSRVGEAGKGESVWLAWFLYATLLQFAPLAEARGQGARAQTWRGHAAALQAAIESEAWDGGWYRRGYFDDGTPLGSVASSECRIDSIAQSWGVISGAADPGRAARAMAAVEEQLIRRHDGLALLFTPPFDRTPLDVGYIKGYPPGLRENGGQYTHAAAWSVIALALQGEGDKAGALFALLNPINHALTAADAFRYKVEPYVVAADIYAAAGHVGRGGWTWYTGSAGWLYRAGVEWILGLRRDGDALALDPCVPAGWPQIELHVRHGSSRYHIIVDNPRGVHRGVTAAELDGAALAERPVRVKLVDDGVDHSVRLTLG